MEKKKMIIAAFDFRIKEELDYVNKHLSLAKKDYGRFFQQYSDTVYKSSQLASALDNIKSNIENMDAPDILDYIQYTIDVNMKSLRTQKFIQCTTNYMVNLSGLLDMEVTQQLLAFLEKVYAGYSK